MVRNKTVPGKYTLGTWQNLPASDAQQELQGEVIATRHLKVVRCDYDAGSDFPEHVHPYEQITIVESGTLEFTLGSENLKVEAGQMISIYPNVAHSTRGLGDEPVKALNIFHSAASDTASLHEGQ